MASDAPDLSPHNPRYIEKISDLIEALETIRRRHGDISVWGSYDSGYMSGPVQFCVRDEDDGPYVDLFVDEPGPRR